MKLIKIITITIYSFIFVNGEHVGGPMILLIALGLFSKTMSSIVASFALLLALAALIFTIVRPTIKNHKIIVVSAMAGLYVPLISHIYYLVDYYHWVDSTLFTIMTGVFVVLSLIWLISILKIQ